MRSFSVTRLPAASVALAEPSTRPDTRPLADSATCPTPVAETVTKPLLIDSRAGVIRLTSEPACVDWLAGVDGVDGVPGVGGVDGVPGAHFNCCAGSLGQPSCVSSP